MILQECETLRELSLDSGQGGVASLWGPDAKQSCIFESLPALQCDSEPHLRSSYDFYKSKRTIWPLNAEVWAVLFASKLTELVLGVLGTGTMLFNDQYIVKPCRSGARACFAWHKDCDWCREGADLKPYISVWVALDDVDETNGCLWIRPGSHTATNYSGGSANDLSKGHPSANSVRGAGREAGGPPEAVPLPLAAGGAVIMMHTVEHCSGPNDSGYARRAWMPQFSMGPITWRATGAPVALAIPLTPAAQVVRA